MKLSYENYYKKIKFTIKIIVSFVELNDSWGVEG